MYSRSRLILSTLFLLLIAEVVQCAPVDKPSVYDKLVELTTSQKCTYLQNTTLLQANQPQFLQKCGSFEEVLAADLSVAYNLEKLHCLLYYDTFEQLCLVGHEEVVSKLVTTAAINKTENAPVEVVCKDLHDFYKTTNVSKLTSRMLQKNYCERLCVDMGNFVSAMKACSLSALMAYAKLQVAQMPFKTVPESEPVQINPVKIVASSSGTGTGTGSGSGAAIPKNMSVLTPKQPQQVEKENDSQSQPLHIESVKQDGVVDLQAHNEQTAQSSPSSTANKGPITQPNQLDSPSEKSTPKKTTEVVMDSVEKQPNQLIVVTKTTAKPPPVDLPPPPPPPQQETEIKKPPPLPVDNTPIKTQVEVKKVTAATKPVAADNEDKDEEMYNNHEDVDEGNQPFDVEAEERLPTLPNEKPRSTNKDEDFNRSVTNDDLPSNDSYFFSYFMMFCILFVMGYVGYHNKQKILALVLEGRRGRRQPRRRPNSANYHKLDSNLEEAVTSSCDKTTSNVIY